ncbi:MAG TPA: response regulator [Armatimonadota bacterium]|nr:response regulator [Armatimonadota bacterium]
MAELTTKAMSSSISSEGHVGVRILIVDDELHLLKKLRSMLAPMQSQWNMTFCKNGHEALEFLAKQPCDIIITDLAMPGMDGIQLLQEIVKRSPQITRLLMVEQKDRERIFRSICLTHQCIAKPCDATSIITAVKRTLSLRNQFSTASLHRIVARVGVLPTMPAMYARLVDLLNRPDASLNQIGKLIEQDPGMSAKVLQLVNSSFFGVRNHVSNTTQAVSMLGLDIIKSLLAWFHLAAKFQHVEEAGVSLLQVQKHSLLTARLAQAIATRIGLDQFDADEAFMAGLLHGVGALIIAQAFPAQYTSILKGRYDRRLSHAGEEQVVFETTHADVGAYLLSLWGFRTPVVEAVLYHHRPRQHSDQTVHIVPVVYLANIFAHYSTGDMRLEIDTEYLTRIGLKLNFSELHDLCEQTIHSMG